MTDISSEAGRQKVATLFLHLVEGVEDERVARLLGIDRRHVQRLRNGPHVPRPDTARRMAELIDLIRKDGLLTPEEKARQDEQRRAEAERRQRATRVATIRGLEKKEIPLWYSKVRALLDEERWQEALERLHDRIEDPTDWRNVPERTRPYVLSDFGVGLHKTGRFHEAAVALRQAIEERQRLSPEPLGNFDRIALDNFLCVAYSNLGCSEMQMHAFDRARDLFRQSIEHRRDWAPAYYNMLCAASLEKNEKQLLQAIGALRLAALTFLGTEDIEEIVQDAENDKDLAFARNFDNLSEVMRELREFAHRKRQGSLRLEGPGPRGGENDAS